MRMRIATLALLAVAATGANAQPAPILPQPAPVLLWPDGGPQQTEPAGGDRERITPQGEHVLTHVAAPAMTPYLPAAGSATGAAVVIAPGGGHSEIWIDHEGYNVAVYLSRHGIAAFVLRYRLAREKNPDGSQQSRYTVDGTELSDMRRAIRVVRSRAREWHIDPARVGVMGFSAGGELAILASTRYDNRSGSPEATSTSSTDQLSDKPAFQALLYPGLPPGLLTDPRLTSATPPAFLACGAEDRPEIAQGLPQLEVALIRLHVSAELHEFAQTGHGFGLRATNPRPVADWPELFVEWLNRLFAPKQAMLDVPAK